MELVYLHEFHVRNCFIPYLAAWNWWNTVRHRWTGEHHASWISSSILGKHDKKRVGGHHRITRVLLAFFGGMGFQNMGFAPRDLEHEHWMCRCFFHQLIIYLVQISSQDFPGNMCFSFISYFPLIRRSALRTFLRRKRHCTMHPAEDASWRTCVRDSKSCCHPSLPITPIATSCMQWHGSWRFFCFGWRVLTILEMIWNDGIKLNGMHLDNWCRNLFHGPYSIES